MLDPIHLTTPNLDRRWWQFWKPKEVPSPRFKEFLTSQMLGELPLIATEVEDDGFVKFGHVCIYLMGAEIHMDISSAKAPTNFREGLQLAKQLIDEAFERLEERI